MGENNMKWALHVKDFGKIKEATVRMSNVVILNGENNTGKSYIMSLLYSLCTYSFYLSDTMKTMARSSSQWVNWIRARLEEGNVSGSFTKEQLVSLNKLLNMTLDKHKNFFVNRALNANISIGSLSIDLNTDNVFNYSFTKNDKTGLEGEEVSWKFFLISKQDTRTPLILTIKGDDDEAILNSIGYILDVLMDKCILINNCGVSFLPTSRTGFMLTYQELSASAINQMYTSSVEQDAVPTRRLTKPSVDFLSFLASLRQPKREINPMLADKIESDILHGKINVQTEPFVKITYTPENSKEELSLHVSSGVVTEIAPLVLALRFSACNTLFIEEPEMCLHPELQWCLAKVLVMLAQKGITIIFTTHSDIIYNYFTQLAIPTKLSEDKVSLYEFRRLDGTTNIKELSPKDTTETLFATTLNRILRELMHRDDQDE